VTHPHPARGIRRRLAPRPGHRRTPSSTHGTPETRSATAVSAAHSSAPSPEGDQAVPDLRPRRDVARPAPTTSAGEAAASGTCHADVPGSGMASPLLYTAEQAAALLQVRPSWLRRKAAARAVPCRFVGKHLRFSRTDIETIAENSATPSRHSS
jgi:helix-turn-helix protein